MALYLMEKTDTMFYIGMLLAGGGAVLASPLDELAAGAVSGPLAPLTMAAQAAWSTPAGIVSGLAGVALMIVASR